MATYIVLLKWTERSKEQTPSLADLDACKRQAEALGVTWKGWYMTFGQYDAVLLLDAPNPAAIARLSLSQASSGGNIYKYFNSETLVAFSEDEFRQVADSLKSAT